MPKNIALLTMSLNIGGAETHIFELACALSESGHNVTVFSAGGVYVDKLEKRGIKHITAPLDTKNPFSILKSYQIIRDYVKNNHPCVIHSHTRISNFTANLISKKYGVPFVSTIHGIYKTGLGARIFSKWGTRALAVSEDRKQYAVDCYDFDPNKIRLTVNGINLKTFCKNDLPDFKASLGLENNRVILCVTRLDPDGCEHVYKLLECAKSIYDGAKDSVIVIVGDGKKADELKRIAAEVNAQTKPDFVRFEGPQTDIYKYCNIADVFVGLSRSALEAMACEVPTVLLGNTGYIGLFSDATRDICINTNFTCRGESYPDNSEISSLIIDMLDSPEKYEANVKAGLDIVKTKYSVSAMANDALLSYNEAERDTHPYDVMLCGYYGRHNLGDDMSLKALYHNLSEVCGVEKSIILTTDAKLTPKTDGTLCVHRFNIPKILRLMKKTRLFILGSGSILQDTTSSRSMFYYLYILSRALKFCPRTMLYSNGVGPINREYHKKRTVKLLNEVDKIMVRDSQSLDYLKEIGVSNENTVLAADETFTLDISALGGKYPLELSKKYLGINLRFLNMSDEFLSEFAQFVNTVSQKYGLTPLLLPVHFEQDIPALKRLSQKLTVPFVFITQKLPHEKTLSIISQCEVSVLERLHAIIFSSIFGTPFMAVDYDPKVMSLCRELSLDSYALSLKGFGAKQAIDCFDSLMQNKDSVCEVISENIAKKRTMAKNNALGAKELLDK